MQTKWTAFGQTVDIALPDDFLAQYERLPKRLKYLVDYGWKQSTADAFASAKDAATFEGKLNARIDKILSGEMVIRDGVTRTTDPVEKEAKAIMEARLQRWKAERKAKGMKKPSDELVEMWIDQQWEKRGEEIRAEAEETVRRRNAIEIDFDLDELVVESDEDEDSDE